MARLFTTSRWLRQYQSKNGNQVFIRIRMHNGFETEIPVYDYVNHKKLPICVKKEHWNKGYVTGGKYHITIRDLNNLLTKVERDVKDAINELIEKNIKITRDNIIRLTYINEDNTLENERKIVSGKIIVDEQGGAFASHDEFTEYIAESEDLKFNTLKKSMGLYKKEYIMDYWDDFTQDFAPASYNAPSHSIQEYIRNTEDNCKATEFSEIWLQKFFEYIIENGYSLRKDGTERQPYTITTIKKYQKHLKYFGDYLFGDIKILENQNYRRFSLKHKKSKKKSLIKYEPQSFINTHALYKKEFDWFYAFKFEDKQLELARDMFILQTWLGGLRQVDFYKLSKQNFHKDSSGIKIWFSQQKTDDEVQNTVNQNYLESILEKYQNIFKKFPRVGIYNKLLKNAAEVAGLKRPLMFRFENVNTDKAEGEWIEIYKKISNNWARNCAVSILSELGYQDDRIAKFTGHKDLGMINHYKSVHKKDIKTMMEEVKPEIVKEL